MRTKKILLLTAMLFSAYCGMALNPIITKTVTPMTCNNNDASIVISVSGGVPPYTYQWTVNNGPVFSINASQSNLGVGFYSLMVFDSNNNSSYDTTAIAYGMQAQITTTNAVCPNNDGTATVTITGGTPPYSYLWSDGSVSATATNLAGGTLMQVQAEDHTGCKVMFTDYNVYPASTSNIGNIKINTSSPINVTNTTTPEQCPLNNGSATLHATGGTAPYTYYWNTTPVQISQTIIGLTAGVYDGKVTDASGCVTPVAIYVALNPGSLDVTAVKTNDQCSKSQGSASITISGGVPPYIIHWFDGSAGTSIAGLGAGYYYVDVTDQNNCTFHRVIFIDDISPAYVSVTATQSNCTNASGSVSAIASGGSAPYSYQWNTGATGASVSNLSKNYYAVLVTDANGCKAINSAYVDISSNCYANISGKIYQDNNGNCVQDATDYPIMNNLSYMHAASASYNLYDGAGYIGTSGMYSMRYVLPDQYTINFYDYVRTAACPAGGKYVLNIPVSGINYPNNDFAMQPKSLEEDVAVLYASIMSDPRPGFDYYYNVAYQNTGTLPSDGFLEIVYGDLETFVSSNPAPDLCDPVNKTLKFNYANLMLGEIRGITLGFHLPASTLIGSSYTHSFTADIGGTDPTPQNNIENYKFTVVGSFDPNEMLVSPKGNITEADSVLSYTIRFQNTGTYPAQLVVIKDTLESNLDISTLSDITASHNFKYKMLENGAVEFAFENIYLPDSLHDQPGSHGFVSFRIKRKPNLALGTEIKNKAEIYFDFNQAVITNVVVNTIAIPTDVIEKIDLYPGKVYPNPAKTFTEFNFQKEISFVQLMNSSGIVVMSEVIKKQKDFKLNLSFSKGMYFYRAIATDGYAYSGKLIIEE